MGHLYYAYFSGNGRKIEAARNKTLSGRSIAEACVNAVRREVLAVVDEARFGYRQPALDPMVPQKHHLPDW